MSGRRPGELCAESRCFASNGQFPIGYARRWPKDPPARDHAGGEQGTRHASAQGVCGHTESCTTIPRHQQAPPLVHARSKTRTREAGSFSPKDRLELDDLARRPNGPGRRTRRRTARRLLADGEGEACDLRPDGFRQRHETGVRQYAQRYRNAVAANRPEFEDAVWRHGAGGALHPEAALTRVICHKNAQSVVLAGDLGHIEALDGRRRAHPVEADEQDRDRNRAGRQRRTPGSRGWRRATGAADPNSRASMRRFRSDGGCTARTSSVRGASDASSRRPPL